MTNRTYVSFTRADDPDSKILMRAKIAAIPRKGDKVTLVNITGDLDRESFLHNEQRHTLTGVVHQIEWTITNGIHTSYGKASIILRDTGEWERERDDDS